MRQVSTLAASSFVYIIGFHGKNPLEGYRRLTFMLLDHDVVAVSPASVWRVLKQAQPTSGAESPD